LVFGLDKEILEKYYSEEQDLPPGIIDNFIARLKNKIEEISSNNIIENRKIDRRLLDNTIKKIITSQGFSKQDKFGNSKRIRIEIPIDKSIEIKIGRVPHLSKPSILPPGDYE